MTDTFVVDETSGKAVIIKDPIAVLDYVFDWTLWLNDIVDTIDTEKITVPTDLTIVSEEIVGKTVVTFIGGGVLGNTYQVECKIVTTGGRTDERSFYMKIKER